MANMQNGCSAQDSKARNQHRSQPPSLCREQETRTAGHALCVDMAQTLSHQVAMVFMTDVMPDCAAHSPCHARQPQHAAGPKP
jgi:hypothetical protein